MNKHNITEEDYRIAAINIGCEIAAIKAVAEVEAPRGPFYETGEPTLLFERHIFHRETGGKWSKSHPDISNPTPGGYGATSKQHERLARAAKLDRNDALRSASWGMFQIMGFNHEAAGHPTLQGFINAMYRDSASQLQAFVAFIRSDKRLLDAIRAKDWVTFARIYNGPGYAAHNYHGRIADAYRQLT